MIRATLTALRTTATMAISALVMRALGAATIAGQSALTVALSAVVALAAAISGVSTVAAVVGCTTALAATVAATSTLTAGLTAQTQLAPLVAATATVATLLTRTGFTETTSGGDQIVTSTGDRIIYYEIA